MRRTLVGLAVLVGACGGTSKEQQAAEGEQKPSAMMPAERTPADSGAKAAPDSGKPSSVTPVTATEQKSGKVKDTRLRDSVTMPIGMIDSNGKLVPLKKRP